MSESRVAVVTGAGSGIGRAVAIALIRAGWTVVLAGRRGNMLDDTIAASGPAGGKGIAIGCDVTDERQVDRLFDDTVSRCGRLDLLFNNAGTGYPAKPVDEIPVEAWRRIIDLNLTGAFLCARAAFRVMRRQRPMGGRIINNGSVSAQAPRPGSAPYTASKHAITGLTRSLALDGRPFNIACGQIDIGNALTEMTAGMTVGVPQADGRIAVEPVMDVAHVAESVVHMASLPLDANILFITVMATNMPLVGRG